MTGPLLSLAAVREGNPDLVAVMREQELLARAYNRRRDALILLADQAGPNTGPMHSDYQTRLAGLLPWTEDDAAARGFAKLIGLAWERYDAAQHADAYPSPESRDRLVLAEDELRRAAISMVRADDLTPRR